VKQLGQPSLVSTLPLNEAQQPARDAAPPRQVVITNMINTESVIVRTATGPGGRSGPLRVDLQVWDQQLAPAAAEAGAVGRHCHRQRGACTCRSVCGSMLRRPVGSWQHGRVNSRVRWCSPLPLAEPPRARDDGLQRARGPERVHAHAAAPQRARLGTPWAVTAASSSAAPSSTGTASPHRLAVHGDGSAGAARGGHGRCSGQQPKAQSRALLFPRGGGRFGPPHSCCTHEQRNGVCAAGSGRFSQPRAQQALGG